jgi:hypothetical protein
MGLLSSKNIIRPSTEITLVDAIDASSVVGRLRGVPHSLDITALSFAIELYSSASRPDMACEWLKHFCGQRLPWLKAVRETRSATAETGDKWFRLQLTDFSSWTPVTLLAHWVHLYKAAEVWRNIGRETNLFPKESGRTIPSWFATA